MGIERGFQACRNPDLIVFAREELRRSDTENNNLFARPALIAECLSPRDRKGSLTDLLDDYRRLRAPDVWIIDPHDRHIEQYSFDEGESHTVITGPVLQMVMEPGVVIPIQSLWDAFDGEW